MAQCMSDHICFVLPFFLEEYSLVPQVHKPNKEVIKLQMGEFFFTLQVCQSQVITLEIPVQVSSQDKRKLSFEMKEQVRSQRN